MVPQDFRALSARRAARARALAEEHTPAREALGFYAHIAELQCDIDPDRPLQSLRPLQDLVADTGPELLRRLAEELDDTACREAMWAYVFDGARDEPITFFARVLLGPVAARDAASGLERLLGRSPAIRAEAGDDRLASCPRCGQPPQLGVLRPEGHGTVLSWSCSLCLHEWPPRSRGSCPACGVDDEHGMAWYRSPELPHVQARACERCRVYLHVINLEREPEAVPDVDEIAALPLDVWAAEHEYGKLHPNLVGA